MFKKLSLALVYIITTCMLACPASAAKLYKWVDSDGKVHYTGTVPPTQSSKERRELSERGVVVGEKEAAKTREELAREKRLKKLREKQKKIVAQQTLRDQTLLKTFSTEDDLVMTRDGKIESFDVMIQLALDRILRLDERLQTLEKSAAAKERTGGVIHFSTKKEIASLKKQINQKHTYISDKKHDQIETREQFDVDLKRFKQLNKHKAVKSVKEKNSVELGLSLVECNDLKDCKTYWERAKSFIENHAPTPLELVSGSILMSEPPASDDSFGVVITLTTTPGSNSELFLDLRCSKSIEGKAACNSPEAQNVRSAFRPFILQEVAELQTAQ